VWTAGVAAGAVAAVATSLVAVVAAAAGAAIAIAGESIPPSGFATLTLVGAVLGVAIAKLVQRTRRPRSMFVEVTVALTALSIIPDLIVDTTWASRLLLAATHVIAAAIVVPVIAHRLEH
jgi:peptidoglycan/LPS O-acetylase OafA/YrhL